MSGNGLETYLTIEEMAAYLKLAAQTIRRYVLNREIPYHKIKKVIRFRVSEIEKWIDGGGLDTASRHGREMADMKENDLFGPEAAGRTGGFDDGN
jgi:excisionase family DNA binding protein